jgi:hypothetical protein
VTTLGGACGGGFTRALAVGTAFGSGVAEGRTGSVRVTPAAPQAVPKSQKQQAENRSARGAVTEAATLASENGSYYLPAMITRVLLVLAGLSALSLAACGSKGSVAVSMEITAPRLEVVSSAVGADASGGFTLRLALGEEAPEATEIALGTFSLQRGSTQLLAPLPLSGATFPVRLAVGEQKTFALTFADGTEPSVADTLCDGPLSVLGAVSDSASGDQPTSIQSPEFSADCSR